MDSFAHRMLGLIALAVAVAAARASADVVVNQFNSASEASQWRYDFGSAGHDANSITFDPTMDANGNPSSGALKFTFTFNTSLGGDNKIAFTRDIAAPGLDGTQFSGMSMDVKVDPSSAKDAFGNNGFFSLVIRNNSTYDYNDQFDDNLNSAAGWRHISVTPLKGAVNDIRGITFQVYGGPSQNMSGSYTMWIDNVVFNQVPEPSSLAAALGGLACLTRGRRR